MVKENGDYQRDSEDFLLRHGDARKTVENVA